MKICLITGSWPPNICGVADGVSIFSGFLTARKNIEAFIITTKGYNCEGFTKDNLKVYDPVKSWTFREMPGIFRLLKKIKPDIVHIQYPTNEYKKNISINLLPVFLRMAGYKVVITIHEYSFNLSFKGRLRLWPAIFGAHSVLVSDKAYIPGIRKVFKKKAIEIIPIAPNIPSSALDREGRKKLKSKLTGGKNILLLGYFGFMNDNKIVLPVVDSVKKLSHDYGIKTKLLLIGNLEERNSKNPHVIALMKHIKELGLKKECIITGYLSDKAVSDYLSVLDFAVLLYKSGVSPRNATFLAALAQNIKIITTENENFRPPYKNVFIVKDDPAIVENICGIILKNKNKPAADSKRDFYKESWEKFTEKHLEVYRKVLKKF